MCNAKKIPARMNLTGNLHKGKTQPFCQRFLFPLNLFSSKELILPERRSLCGLLPKPVQAAKS